MWRPWGKSTVQIHSPSSSLSPSFSCSSFKDIQTLCLDEPSPSPIPRKTNVFHRVRLANSILRKWSTALHPQLPDESTKPAPIYFPGTEELVVVYFTSLRVVRSTFEDCKSVLAILRAFRVKLDERDVSMDSGFMSELNRIMGRTGLTLPRVFIGGRYVGGAEEVRQMHEVGELKKILGELPAVDPSQCHVCAGDRFVVCDVCYGSRKVYTDKAGFKACTACNDNGLARCPSCLAAPFYHQFKTHLIKN